MRRLLTAALIFWAGQAVAQESPIPGTIAIYISGEELAKYCRAYLTISRAGGVSNSPSNAHHSGICFGFVIGIVEGLQWADDRAIEHDIAMSPFCLEFASSSSIVESVGVWLDEHPEQRAASGYVLTRRALAAKFPC